MKEPLTIELVGTCTDADGVRRWTDAQKWEQATAGDLAQLQNAVSTALGTAALQKAGVKVPVDPGRPGGGPAKP